MPKILARGFLLLSVSWLPFFSSTFAGRTEQLTVEGINTSMHGKPSGGLNISLVPTTDISSVGGEVYAELAILPEVDISSLKVYLISKGVSKIKSDSVFELLSLKAWDETNVTVNYVTDSPGEGEVRAKVEAFDDVGRHLITKMAVIYVLSVEGDSVLHSTSGPLELQVRKIDRNYKKGNLSSEEYDSAIEGVLGGGAAETGSILESADATITIAGQIRWTDSGGGTHPVRLSSVEIRDDELIGSELVTTVTTDENGNYSATVDNNDGLLQNGRDIFIRVLAEGPGFIVKLPGLLGEVHRIQSSVHPDLADGTVLNINLTANNTDDNNTAFSVHDALVTVNKYVPRVNGALFPDIDVIFPTTRGTSQYDPLFSNLHVLRFDRFDWDVIHHEFGHYVMDKLNIEDNPGGEHSSLQNLGEIHGKDKGILLAWGEGWPTYFGTSVQQIQGTSSFGVPNVGDTRYQDTEDITINYDLESQTGSPSLGEDNELSVQRILWDIFDSADDAGDKGVSLGDITIWSTLDAADPTTLSAAYQALISGRSISEITQIGCIMSEHNVAPDPISPADKIMAPETPPNFQWEPNGGGPSNLNNQFVVEFYDSFFGTLLFTSPQQTSTDFTPTQEQWDDIVESAVGGINWLIKGTQTNSPSTGPYTSCGRLIQTGAPVDVFLLVDLSGSFTDDLPVFKAQAPGIISSLTSSNPNTRFGIGKFEDYPISPFGTPSCGDKAYERLVDLTFNKDLVLNTIQGLFTRCGADLPQSQLPALYQAATGAGQDLSGAGYPGASIPVGQQANFREGTTKLFLLWTDASFHHPGDPGAIPYPGPGFGETVDAILSLDPPQVIGISSGGGGASDLQAIAAATGALAPPDGLDCNGDGIIDVLGGEPMVCNISSAGTGIAEAIIALVEAAQKPSVMQVKIDVKPLSCPNPLNIGDNGVLPVAILGTDALDVTQIDVATIELEGIAPLWYSLEDVTAPFTEAQNDCLDCSSAGSDGRVDLTLKFNNQSIASSLGNIIKGQCRELKLTGSLYDGTPIEGKDMVIIKTPAKSADENLQAQILPTEFMLSQNYPNPFNSMTTVRYALPTETDVRIDVYNILGQKVRTLVDGIQTAGYKSVNWDGKNESGEDVSSGIYLYRIQTNEYGKTMKMIFLK
jgi:hypothetical protein